jgi:membrane-associated phospholipid phosphatase
VTAALLACDWRWCRTRFWIILLPGIGLMFATLPLRLHFAVDLLAGALLLGPVLWLTLPKESDDDA